MNPIRRCCSSNDAEGYFVVSRTSDNRWCVTTPDQRTGGFFSSEDDAHRFARTEARNRGHAEIIVVGEAGLDIEVFDQSRLGKSLHVDYDGAATPIGEQAR